jgi:hypothetical protein
MSTTTSPLAEPVRMPTFDRGHRAHQRRMSDVSVDAA